MNKRKIAVVVASRANYGRIRSVLRAIENHPKLELLLIVGASALLYRFGLFSASKKPPLLITRLGLLVLS